MEEEEGDKEISRLLDSIAKYETPVFLTAEQVQEEMEALEGDSAALEPLPKKRRSDTLLNLGHPSAESISKFVDQMDNSNTKRCVSFLLLFNAYIGLCYLSLYIAR